MAPSKHFEYQLAQDALLERIDYSAVKSARRLVAIYRLKVSEKVGKCKPKEQIHKNRHFC
jgi:hypothetical protein